jgi:hypothetical protein
MDKRVREVTMSVVLMWCLHATTVDKGAEKGIGPFETLEGGINCSICLKASTVEHID